MQGHSGGRRSDGRRGARWKLIAVPVMGLSMVVGLWGSSASANPAQTVQRSFSGQVTSNTFSAKAGSGPQAASAGQTVDPLKDDCTYGSAACGNVGLTHSWLSQGTAKKGSTIDLLYSARYSCNRTVESHAESGCEAGAKPKNLPLGATSQDPVYVITPLGFDPSGLQCPKVGRCIDHPATVDMSRLAGALGVKDPATLYNVPLSPHSHIVTTRNNNLPEWWNVVVIGVTSPASYAAIMASQGSIATVRALQANSKAGVTADIPTDIFLYFQTLAGTVPASQGYHLPAGPTQAGAAGSPLTTKCTDAKSDSTCHQIGQMPGFLRSHTLNFLYTENYFCDRSVSAKSSTHCEAGAAAKKLPPGTPSKKYLDPLDIIVPLFSPEPSGLQCPTPGFCLDHPQTVDLSRLASALGVTNPSTLDNVALPPHNHIVFTTNHGQPEWWNVNVIGVTSRTTYNKIMSAKYKYAEIQRLRAEHNTTVTANIPTNIDLWFSVL